MSFRIFSESFLSAYLKCYTERAVDKDPKIRTGFVSCSVILYPILFQKTTSKYLINLTVGVSWGQIYFVQKNQCRKTTHLRHFLCKSLYK